MWRSYEVYVLEAKYKNQVLNYKTCEKPPKNHLKHLNVKKREKNIVKIEKRNILPLCVGKKTDRPM